jgi:hypothetical protein
MMRRLVLVSALASALGAASVGLAASVGVSSAKLTAYSAAITIPASSCSLTSTADAYAYLFSANTNFGTGTTMFVQDRTGRHQRSFAQFDVASCVPGNALVVSASLGLYLVTAPASNRTYNANRVTASWVETTMTWNNQPAVNGAATATVATGTTNGVTLTWNITGDVQLYADGTSNFGWRIADAAEGANNNRQGTFRTRETGTVAQRPNLAITYYP